MADKVNVMLDPFIRKIVALYAARQTADEACAAGLLDKTNPEKFGAFLLAEYLRLVYPGGGLW